MKPKHVLEVGLNMNKMVKTAQELSMIDGFIDQRLVFLTNSGPNTGAALSNHHPYFRFI